MNNNSNRNKFIENNNYGNNSLNNYGYSKKGNETDVKEQKSNPANLFLTFLLVITFGVMIFNVVSVVKHNASINQEKKDEKEPTNITDNRTETEIKEQRNKEELTKLCKLVDDRGSYKYEEYIKYINSYDSNITDSEKYKIMSKKNYCHQWMCIKIEEEGIINYVECDTGDYIRVSFEEYQDLQKEQNRATEALNNACKKLDDSGHYDSGAATGLRVTCNNHICSLDYDGEIVTKNCKK